MKLIDGRLVFTPHADEMIHRFAGRATRGPLLEGLVVVGSGGEPDDRGGNGRRSITIGVAFPSGMSKLDAGRPVRAFSG
jgi:hypothetical protein